MKYKEIAKILGFLPKENTVNIYHKKYTDLNNYCIEIDFENENIYYGNLIKSESKTTQNFSQKENLVVLECVDRLLSKGYQPQSIVLEKTWATGQGTSGRLDILVTRNDGTAYLMIECKTWGTEFDKEFKKIQKDGGQLFTYFQQDKNADILMLYASEFDKGEINYKNLIIKIEEDYRQTANVKDFYERWNKLPKTNGIFENWVTPYEYKSKAILKGDLKELKQEHSSFIFNRFLEILRHNVVSDKPNAFNKIFTLFLCKIVDEYSKNGDDELEFQWLEGEDNHISFQKRLTDLYRKGMKELLEKNVTDVSDSEFDKRFQQIEDKYRAEIKDIFTELRLKKNNEFAIKEVYDDDSFLDNAKVVKEVVELLQEFRLRYNYRQQFLSDFFELLLTTGLKQESGQFFTPVPIARFILRSIPINDITENKLQQGNKNDLLPLIIDYAAGSGHFVTESMEDIQKHIDSLDENNFTPATKRALKKWKDDQFDWADDYVYAIEKDYRLIKTAKVSCYLHGDGLAKVIHGDGLGDFATSKEFKDLLKIADKTYSQDNKQFDIVVSNPPYSVSAFKGTMMDKDKAEKAFDLYSRVTDQSSEIECLFVERTKQLLKDGGIAGIILPSSILSNSGIYTQTREIIFKYFEIIAITELGNNTFMATGTNTVILFLRRRNNADCVNIRAAVDKFSVNQQDVTINGIEKPVTKYITQVWEGINFDDYITLIQKQPNEIIKQHELYKEYNKKIKVKDEQEKADKILSIELEKLFYFIMAYPQKIVLIKSGERDAEKQFLGYEFSYRRGSEGIHPIQRSKSIDECTKLYDAHSFNNLEKASTYIYKTFKGEQDFGIHESLQKNVNQCDLVNMLTFDRIDFEKTISLTVDNKTLIKSIWPLKTIGSVCNSIIAGGDVPKDRFSEIPTEKYFIPIYSNSVKSKGLFGYTDIIKVDYPCVTVSARGTIGYTLARNEAFYLIVRLVVLEPKEKIVKERFLEIIINRIDFGNYAVGTPQLSVPQISDYKIPLPPKEIQDKIVAEIEVLEEQEKESKKKTDRLKNEIADIISKATGALVKLEEITRKIGSGATPLGGKGVYQERGINFIRSQNIYDDGFVEEGLAFINEEQANKLNNVAVEKNDILFNITGASIARCCIVPDKYLPARVNQHVSIIRVNEKSIPKYVQMILVSKQYKNSLLQIGNGATSREAITKSQLENFKIPLPDLNAQKQIIKKIEKFEKQIADLKKQIEQIPKQKELILKKYLE